MDPNDRAEFSRRRFLGTAGRLLGDFGGDGSDTTLTGRTALAENGHLHFANGQRGYVRCAVTPGRWTADYRVVPYVGREGAPISTPASFIVDAGRSGAQPL
jgi:alkaline phosphatase D